MQDVSLTAREDYVGSEIYIVSSPGRVGSGLLRMLLTCAGREVIPTHNPYFVPPPNSILIQVYRKDLFSNIMSSFVADHTNETHEWSGQSFSKFNIDCGKEFRNKYLWHKWFHRSCVNLDQYLKVLAFYMEDFINDYDHVYDRLGIIKPPHLDLPKTKCPHNYLDLVTNIEECKHAFQLLEQNNEDFIIPQIH